MTPEARARTQVRAERALRRGELAEAVSLYESLRDAFPDDGALHRRLEGLRELLLPAELHTAPARTAAPSPPPAPASPAHEGERLFALGDYAAAAAAYRRALRERPHSELLRERLVELYRLACLAPPSSPTDRRLPGEREGLLQALLDRVAARRRA